MKLSFNLKFYIYFLALATLSFASCRKVTPKENTKVTESKIQNIEAPKKELSEAFKKYWYAGTAEITSYRLEQARYGEIREGEAVLIYVTEPFLVNKQVKADRSNPENIAVLKLNTTKKFLTGIYPYSIMTSSFYPVDNNGHAVKISNSAQEWCGHVYAQLNNREEFEVMSHSYFESEADQEFNLTKTILEDELWNKIRVDPKSLPTGSLQIIPSMEFTRLRHKEFKAYEATVTLTNNGRLSNYTISYPALDRTLEINFSKDFPHTIENWSETAVSGFGPGAKQLTTRATKIKTLNTPYWQKNHNSDLFLRDSLGLK
ncbi:septum formation inhibitor Maf [Flavobacteriaceae bacterium KMM 6897]|nr:septum formation inhibitor Maf [Flavobacteriaceae bacterium KMM 6897]MEB8345172.1 septum formation inhibitor Maf [Flavobacteriaceae bacterium KMM 6898]